MKRIVCVVDVKAAYSTSRQRATDDELLMEERMSLAWVVAKHGRDQSVVDVVNMPSAKDGAWSLRGAS